MTHQPRPLYEVLRDMRDRQRHNQPGALWVAVARALTTPPDPNYEAFQQMHADTIRQQERQR